MQHQVDYTGQKPSVDGSTDSGQLLRGWTAIRSKLLWGFGSTCMGKPPSLQAPCSLTACYRDNGWDRGREGDTGTAHR